MQKSHPPLQLQHGSMWQFLIGQELDERCPGVALSDREEGRKEITRKDTTWPLSKSNISREGGREGGRE